MGRIVPYIMENNKCLKPPTSEHVHFPLAAGCLNRHTYILSPLGSIGDILELPFLLSFRQGKFPINPMTDPNGAGIYANIGGILMGSMLPYIAAPWIPWECLNFWWADRMLSFAHSTIGCEQLDFVGNAGSGAACSCRVSLLAVFVLPALLLNHSFMFGRNSKIGMMMLSLLIKWNLLQLFGELVTHGLSWMPASAILSKSTLLMV